MNPEEIASLEAATVFGMTLDEVRQMMKRDAERRQTCKVESCTAFSYDFSPEVYYEFKMQCGGSFDWNDEEPPTHCPNCGAKVVSE